MGLGDDFTLGVDEDSGNWKLMLTGPLLGEGEGLVYQGGGVEGHAKLI